MRACWDEIGCVWDLHHARAQQASGAGNTYSTALSSVYTVHVFGGEEGGGLAGPSPRTCCTQT